MRIESPVVGVGDHAISIENPADGLLWPVARGQLGGQQALGRTVQRLGITSMLICCHQGKHCPGCVDDL